jgi:hypothetical protein
MKRTAIILLIAFTLHACLHCAGCDDADTGFLSCGIEIVEHPGPAYIANTASHEILCASPPAVTAMSAVKADTPPLFKGHPPQELFQKHRPMRAPPA